MMKLSNKLFFAIVGCIFLLLANNVGAQEQASLADKAHQFYLAGEYAKAADMYNRVQQSRKLSNKEMAAVADAYYQINAYTDAEKWLEKLVASDPTKADVALKHARLVKINGKYEEAKAKFLAFQQRFPQGKDVRVEIAGCDSALLWMAQATKHTIKNEHEVNTSRAEFAVLPLSNGALYTAEPAIQSTKISGMTGQAYLKVFSAGRDQDGISLKYPVLMEDVFNSADYHVGPVATNEKQDVLFVTRTYMGKDAEKVKRDSMRFKRYNLELIVYRKQGSSWIGEPFPYNNVEKYSLGHAALNTDGNVLYFASDMPGGKGGVDIWFSEKNSDGSWGKPQNAGPEINGNGDEMFPSVFADTLYFSSDSYASMGGLDIFKAVGQKAAFSGRQSLRYPVNSSADDFAFVVSADDEERQYGYLASNRSGGAGSDDIYSFVYNKPRTKVTITLAGKVYDKATSELLRESRVHMFDNNGGLLSSFAVSDSHFDKELEPKTAYKFVVFKEGYMSDSLFVSGVTARRDTTLFANFRLQPVNKKGISFVLDNIYYDFDKYDIRSDAAVVLDQLVKVMKDNPTLRIELSSHTDSRGSDKYNLVLSQHRARSAVEYIVSRGIERERLVAKGYGEMKLVNKCANGVTCSEEEHQANRRTEVEVLAY
ncbi:OmpA family protein [Sphingobacterium psychroaquaticum]|uniref:OmpA family protein n=1 Tax=Sphingobacterium psychroaquaticum TaxID=561061 RepID=A0A1X7JIR6_9SPHI|nr:OmpA family protein [Sphingobacterium psychroaquaticum]SMG27630.1 OmpA family protein [Sphingobacterium psychroaquaticum]